MIPKKGDRAFVVDDSEHVVIRVKTVERAGELRVVTIGPGGRTQHQLIANTDPPRYLPSLHLTASAALEQYVARREADVLTADRRRQRALDDLADARKLLDDYRDAERARDRARTTYDADGSKS